MVYASVGPFVDRLECDAHLIPVLQRQLDQFVEENLGSPWGGKIQFSPKELRQLVAKQYEEIQVFSVGRMTQLHLLLHFDRM